MRRLIKHTLNRWSSEKYLFGVVFCMLVCVLYLWILPIEKPWEPYVILYFSIPFLCMIVQIGGLAYSCFHIPKILKAGMVQIEDDPTGMHIRLHLRSSFHKANYHIVSVLRFKQNWQGIRVYGKIISEYTYDHNIYQGKGEVEKKKRILVPAYFDLDAILPYIEHMVEFNPSSKISDMQ